jgi:hypothetical protein
MSNMRAVLFASTDKIETGDRLNVGTGKIKRRSFVPVEWAKEHSSATKRSDLMPFVSLNADRIGRTLYLALLCLAIAGTGMAQSIELPGQQQSGQVSVQAAPADNGQTGLVYFLGQQDVIQADAAKLQAKMDDLQKKYAADPNAGLREEIREREAFVARLQSERADARKFVSPTLAVTVDWVVRDAQEGANVLKAQLNASLRVADPERAALKAQIENLEKEVDRNAKVAKALAEKIKSLADDRRREGVMSELDALTKPTSIGSLAGTVSGVIIRGKEEKQ